MSRADTRIPFSEGMSIASKIMNLIRPECERLEIAGSLRRKAKTIGDIELVGIVKPEADLFGVVHRDPVRIIDRLTRAGGRMVKGDLKYLQFDIEIRGGTRMFGLDLFLTTPEQWGLILAIRTGSAHFSHRLVTSVEMGGMMPAGMCSKDGWLWRYGLQVETPEESDLFREIGQGYVEPEKRD